RAAQGCDERGREAFSRPRPGASIRPRSARGEQPHVLPGALLAVLLELAVEGAPVDAQDLSGADLVAARLAHDPQDVLALQAVETPALLRGPADDVALHLRLPARRRLEGDGARAGVHDH